MIIRSAFIDNNIHITSSQHISMWLLIYLFDFITNCTIYEMKFEVCEHAFKLKTNQDRQFTVYIHTFKLIRLCSSRSSSCFSALLTSPVSSITNTPNFKFLSCNVIPKHTPYKMLNIIWVNNLLPSLVLMYAIVS